MRLSYNSIFFKIYCLIFAKKVGEDEYGNSYFIKSLIHQKITIEKEDLLITEVLLKQVRFLNVGMLGYTMLLKNHQ